MEQSQHINSAIPDTTRKEILRLDMHDVLVAEIARLTGVKRSTVSAIIVRTRGTRESTHRGDNFLLHDPAGIFTPGARFNGPDLETWVRLGGLVNGTLFEVARRDGSVYRAEVRGGELVRCQ